MVSNQKLLPSATFLFFLLLYIHNLSRSVYGGDVGDLVTSSYVFGVAHPPGYPLFSLLGYIFSHGIPISTIAFRVGLISAVASALGVLFFYLTIQKLTKNTLLSLLGSLILGLNYFYWFYAEIAEVFALNNFFIIILFYLGVSLYLEKKKMYFYLLCFFMGLSVTNHHTIIFIFPSLLLLSFSTLWEYFRTGKKALFLGVLFSFGGFLVYLYIPFAAATHAPMNWGNVHDINSFFHVLLRKDYGTFSAGIFTTPNMGQRMVILQTYLLQVLQQVTIPVCLISFIGMIYLIKKKRVIAISFLLGLLLSGPIFVTYAGFPLYSSFNLGVYERFFLMSVIISLLFFPFGLVCITSFIKPYFRKESIFILSSVFFLVPCMLFYYNFPKTNLSNVYIGDTLGKDLLSSLPKDAVILLAGDSILFNSLYVQHATHFRNDVTILNINGFEMDPYYLKMKKEFIKKHPHIKDKNKIANQTILEIAKKRSLFSIQNIKLSNEHIWVPYGLVSKLVLKDKIPEENEYKQNSRVIWKNLHVPVRNEKGIIYGSLTLSEYSEIYANALLVTGYYFFSQYKNISDAEQYFEKAKIVDSQNPKAYSVIGIYEYTMRNNCKKGEKNLRKAINLNPFEKINYGMLYSLAQTCYKDTQMQKEIQSQYERTFESSFEEEVEKGKRKTL